MISVSVTLENKTAKGKPARLSPSEKEGPLLGMSL